MSRFSLSDLDKIIAERALASESASYTASLMKKGVNKCAEKLGEEATEAIIAAVTDDKENLVKESADILYHLLVLLKISNVNLDEVMEELATRTSQSGLQEKATRGKKSHGA